MSLSARFKELNKNSKEHRSGGSQDDDVRGNNSLTVHLVPAHHVPRHSWGGEATTKTKIDVKVTDEEIISIRGNLAYRMKAARSIYDKNMNPSLEPLFNNETQEGRLKLNRTCAHTREQLKAFNGRPIALGEMGVKLYYQGVSHLARWLRQRIPKTVEKTPRSSSSVTILSTPPAMSPSRKKRPFETDREPSSHPEKRARTTLPVPPVQSIAFQELNDSTAEDAGLAASAPRAGTSDSQTLDPKGGHAFSTESLYHHAVSKSVSLGNASKAKDDDVLITGSVEPRVSIVSNADDNNVPNTTVSKNVFKTSSTLAPPFHAPALSNVAYKSHDFVQIESATDEKVLEKKESGVTDPRDAGYLDRLRKSYHVELDVLDPERLISNWLKQENRRKKKLEEKGQGADYRPDGFVRWWLQWIKWIKSTERKESDRPPFALAPPFSLPNFSSDLGDPHAIPSSTSSYWQERRMFTD